MTWAIACLSRRYSGAIVNQINLAVVLTMAATPLLATAGGHLKELLKSDQSVASLAGAYTRPLFSST